MRRGSWKLHFHRDGDRLQELYDLERDPGETKNLYDNYPEIVEELNHLAQKGREELGDDVMGVKGTQTRPKGVVTNPKALTQYDPEHPYMVAMYDLADSKVMVG